MDMELLMEKEQISDIISDPYKYAAIYARESNLSAPNPIETQKYICSKYALEKNLFVYKEYSELISASMVPYNERAKLMELINDARKGYFKNIIVTRRDRLTRSFEEYIELRNIFKKLGVEILYSNDIEINEKKSYAASFIENIIMGLAEMEPRRISARREAGINAKIQKGKYDRAASYGLRYDKYEKKYYNNGLKARVVKDIFDIFLDNKEIVNSKQVLEKLHDLVDKVEEKDKKEYQELVSKLKDLDVKKILSRPVYAGIQPANTRYKYKMFYIEYNGKFIQANEEYFLPYDNIDKVIITSEQWFKTVDKWCKNNKKNDDKKVRNPREKVILEKSLKCGKCNKTLKYSKGKYSCGTKGCREIRKDILIKKLIKGVVEWLAVKQNSDSIIKDVVKELEHKISEKEKELLKLVNEQKEFIGRYIENISDNQIKEEIITKQKESEKVKSEIEDLVEKKQFINYKLRELILPLARTDYYDLILEDLEKNHLSLLEIFIHQNIKELKINGQKFSIIDRTGNN